MADKTILAVSYGASAPDHSSGLGTCGMPDGCVFLLEEA